MKYALITYLTSVSLLSSAPVAVAPDGTGISNPNFRAAVLNGSGVSETELGYLDGVTGPIPTLLAGKQDTLTNTTLNAILDDNPAASREAARVMPSQPLTPFITTELRRHQMESATVRSLTIFAFGDSMCARSMAQLYPMLESTVPIVGYALDSLRYLTLSGTVVPPAANSGDSGATTAPTMWDTGRIWAMSSGSAIKIGRTYGGAAANEVYGKNITVWCSKQAGGGTLTVAYSVNGGSSYTDLGTIDTSTTSGSALDMARGTFALAGDRYALYKVTASGGPVNLIGAKIWDSTRSGVILAQSSMGGIPIASTSTAPAGIRNQIAADLGTTAMFWLFREGDSEMSQSQLNTAIDGWRTAFASTYSGPNVTIPNAEIVLFKQHTRYDITDTDAQPIKSRMDACAADRPNVKLFDMDSFLPSWDYMTNNGWFYTNSSGSWASDYIHLSDYAWRVLGAELCNRWFRVAVDPVVGVRTTSTSGAEEILYGNRVDKTQYRDHLFSADYAAKGRMQMYSRKLDGNPSRLGFYWKAPTDSYLPNGFAIENFTDGGSTTPWIADQNGYSYFGPYNATYTGAYAAGSRVHIVEDYNAKACLTLKHTSASATDILKIQNSAGSNIFKVARDGTVVQVPPASVTPASNGDLVIEATNNTTLTFKLKGTDGTVRSAVLTLAP